MPAAIVIIIVSLLTAATILGAPHLERAPSAISSRGR